MKRWRCGRGDLEAEVVQAMACRAAGVGDVGGIQLGDVYREYWRVLYGRARSRGHGHEDSCDLVQGFFLDLQRGDAMGRYDARLGGQGTYVNMLFSRYAAKEERRIRCLKRGGRVEWVYLDELSDWDEVGWLLRDEVTPERELELSSALEVIHRALERGEGGGEYGILLAEVGWDEVALPGSHAMPRRCSPGATRAAACRVRREERRRLHRALLAELAGGVDVEGELRGLWAVFR